MSNLDEMFKQSKAPSHGSIGCYDYDQEQKKIKMIQAEMQARAAQADKGMKRKLERIADLFEMDVLSEDDALKACKTVIQQHAKVKGKVGSDNIDDR